MKALIIFIFLLAIVAACNPSPNIPTAPKTLTNCNEETTVLHVTWYTSIPELEAMCGKGAAGCTSSIQVSTPEGTLETHSYIRVLKPRNFNDFERLETLGHEVCHGLGGSHEKWPEGVITK